MKSILFTAFLILGLISLSQGQNLVFVNVQSNATTPKFEIKSGKTLLYQMVGTEVQLTKTWNQAPKLISSEDRLDRYSGVFFNDDRVANKKYEIHYDREHGTNRYTGYIKTTINYKDSRPTKVLEHRFKLQGQ
ncbi:hypothetical protein [Algoriphagus sp.]|uniref:hypothetical protein n=1 Tax=Algoriphagus sp. TaxID=1872435 RepID=UPI003919428A